MILDKIQAAASLTVQENSAWEYIKHHPQQVLTMSIKQLAKASYTSPATIVRLCKKAGVKGYGEFKYLLAAQLPTMIQLDADLQVTPFHGNEKLTDILQKVSLVQQRAISYTQQTFNLAKLNRVSSLVQKAAEIEIYGDCLNYALAQLFCWNFEEVGTPAQAFDSINLMHSQSPKNKRLAFILTHTGNNPHMYRIALKLHCQHYQTIAVCDSYQRKVSQVCDETLIVMTTKNTLELSNSVYATSLQYLFDVLVTIKMLQNYDQVARKTKLVDQEKEQ